MKKRTILGMAVTALACGMMAAALCPGTALARYAPDTLTESDMASATTIKAGQTLKASVTNANEDNENNTTGTVTSIDYCTDTSVVKFYKFTAPKTGTYTFYSRGDQDMWGALYKWDGTSANYYTHSDDCNGYDFSITEDFTAGDVYYVAACTYNPTKDWSSSFTFCAAKKAVSATYATMAPKCSSVLEYGVTKAVLTYADGTSGVTYLYNDSSSSDDFGNSISLTFATTEDEDNYDSGIAGTYSVNATLCDYTNTLVGSASTIKLVIASEDSVAAYAKALPFGTYATPGVYKFTAKTNGFVKFSDTGVCIYKLKGTTPDSREEGMTEVVKGTTYLVDYTDVYLAGARADFYTVNNDITKSAQTIGAKVKAKTYKAKKLKKKKATFKIGATAKTKLTYKVIAGKKWVTVTKAGKVTVKKGAKKGVYKVQVTAAADGCYKAATKIIKIKVK